MHPGEMHKQLMPASSSSARCLRLPPTATLRALPRRTPLHRTYIPSPTRACLTSDNALFPTLLPHLFDASASQLDPEALQACLAACHTVPHWRLLAASVSAALRPPPPGLRLPVLSLRDTRLLLGGCARFGDWESALTWAEFHLTDVGCMNPASDWDAVAPLLLRALPEGCPFPATVVRDALLTETAPLAALVALTAGPGCPTVETRLLSLGLRAGEVALVGDAVDLVAAAVQSAPRLHPTVTNWLQKQVVGPCEAALGAAAGGAAPAHPAPSTTPPSMWSALLGSMGRGGGVRGLFEAGRHPLVVLDGVSGEARLRPHVSAVVTHALRADLLSGSSLGPLLTAALADPSLRMHSWSDAALALGLGEGVLQRGLGQPHAPADFVSRADAWLRGVVGGAAPPVSRSGGDAHPAPVRSLYGDLSLHVLLGVDARVPPQLGRCPPLFRLPPVSSNPVGASGDNALQLRSAYNRDPPTAPAPSTLPNFLAEPSDKYDDPLFRGGWGSGATRAVDGVGAGEPSAVRARLALHGAYLIGVSHTASGFGEWPDPLLDGPSNVCREVADYLTTSAVDAPSLAALRDASGRDGGRLLYVALRLARGEVDDAFTELAEDPNVGGENSVPPLPSTFSPQRAVAGIVLLAAGRLSGLSPSQIATLLRACTGRVGAEVGPVTARLCTAALADPGRDGGIISSLSVLREVAATVWRLRLLGGPRPELSARFIRAASAALSATPGDDLVEPTDPPAHCTLHGLPLPPPLSGFTRHGGAVSFAVGGEAVSLLTLLALLSELGHGSHIAPHVLTVFRGGGLTPDGVGSPKTRVVWGVDRAAGPRMVVTLPTEAASPVLALQAAVALADAGQLPAAASAWWTLHQGGPPHGLIDADTSRLLSSLSQGGAPLDALVGGLSLTGAQPGAFPLTPATVADILQGAAALVSDLHTAAARIRGVLRSRLILAHLGDAATTSPSLVGGGEVDTLPPPIRRRLWGCLASVCVEDGERLGGVSPTPPLRIAGAAPPLSDSAVLRLLAVGGEACIPRSPCLLARADPASPLHTLSLALVGGDKGAASFAGVRRSSHLSAFFPTGGELGFEWATSGSQGLLPHTFAASPLGRLVGAYFRCALAGVPTSYSPPPPLARAEEEETNAVHAALRLRAACTDLAAAVTRDAVALANAADASARSPTPDVAAGRAALAAANGLPREAVGFLLASEGAAERRGDGRRGGQGRARLYEAAILAAANAVPLAEVRFLPWLLHHASPNEIRATAERAASTPPAARVARSSPRRSTSCVEEEVEGGEYTRDLGDDDGMLLLPKHLTPAQLHSVGALAASFESLVTRWDGKRVLPGASTSSLPAPPARHSLPARVDSYPALLASLEASSAAAVATPRLWLPLALKLGKECVGAGFPLTERASSSLLAACGRQRDHRSARAVFGALREAGVLPLGGGEERAV